MSKWMSYALLVALLPAIPGAPRAGDSPAKTSPPIPLLLEPASGYWLDPDRPGTGFALQRRGTLLGLVFYHFTGDGLMDWHLASGALAGDAFEAPLLHFSGGSCLACDPFAPADAEPTELQVRLSFASAREATLQIGEAEPRRVVAMAYGVPYEADVGTPAGLPLADLRGRWLLDRGAEAAAFTLEARFATEDGFEYRGRATALGMPNASMLCDAQACELWVDPLPDFAPPPAMIGRFLIGDITEERMTGADALTLPLQAFRMSGSEVQP